MTSVSRSEATEASIVIPARWDSVRYPGKVLASIHGRPLLWYVWRRAMEAKGFSQVFVATDSPEVQRQAESWGARVLPTSTECRSGTERIASIIDEVPGTWIANVQADDPTLDPALLAGLLQAMQRHGWKVGSAVYRLGDERELHDSNRVKVVKAGARAIYFSRSVIPFLRDLPADQWTGTHDYWGHVGIYAFRREVLEDYAQLPVSQLETAEKLEQLRLLEAGYEIHLLETDYHPRCIDTPADLARIEYAQVADLLPGKSE